MPMTYINTVKANRCKISNSPRKLTCKRNPKTGQLLWTNSDGQLIQPPPARLTPQDLLDQYKPHQPITAKIHPPPQGPINGAPQILTKKTPWQAANNNLNSEFDNYKHPSQDKP